jgi:hypothetical protein
LMLEWETFRASSLRLPVMSLFAMSGLERAAKLPDYVELVKQRS